MGAQYTGSYDPPRNPILTRAYCEGRRAAIDGLTTGDNPHPAAQEELQSAWLRGFSSYTAGMRTELHDCCADVGLITFPPATTVTPDAQTLVDVGFELVPAYACHVSFGDGTEQFTEGGTFDHTYPDFGDYTITYTVYGKTFSEVASVGPPTITATPDQETGLVITFELDPPFAATWDFGDDSTPEAHTLDSFTHTYEDEGTYTVSFKVFDKTFSESVEVTAVT